VTLEWHFVIANHFLPLFDAYPCLSLQKLELHQTTIVHKNCGDWHAYVFVDDYAQMEEIKEKMFRKKSRKR
jgi:hypothetical protein